MNFMAEWNRMYDFCMSNKLSKSEVLLLHALYMVNNKKDWDAWFEADNYQVQRLTGGLSRQSINEARNKLKQRGRIEFRDGKKNQQSPFYRIIPFSGILDIQPDIQGDIQGDIQPDIQGDHIRNKLNQTNIPPPTDVEVLSIDDLFEKTYQTYPRKEGKAKGMATYRLYLTKGKEIARKRYRFNHQQIYIAISRYADDCEGKDPQYIKHFDSWMNGPIVDYVDRTAPDYQAFMQEKYGEEWGQTKFEYA